MIDFTMQSGFTDLILKLFCIHLRAFSEIRSRLVEFDVFDASIDVTPDVYLDFSGEFNKTMNP